MHVNDMEGDSSLQLDIVFEEGKHSAHFGNGILNTFFECYFLVLCGVIHNHPTQSCGLWAMIASHTWLGNGFTQNAEQDSGNCVGQDNNYVIACLEYHLDAVATILRELMIRGGHHGMTFWHTVGSYLPASDLGERAWRGCLSCCCVKIFDIVVAIFVRRST
jgi:hypothetical protein